MLKKLRSSAIGYVRVALITMLIATATFWIIAAVINEVETKSALRLWFEGMFCVVVVMGMMLHYLPGYILVMHYRVRPY